MHRAVILCVWPHLLLCTCVHIFSKAWSWYPATASQVMGPLSSSPSPRTVLFSTVRKPWTDVIPCSYEMQHTLKDLVPLKAFLLAGTTVTIVEEKVGGRDSPFPVSRSSVMGPRSLVGKVPASPRLACVHSWPPRCPLDSLLACGAASC